MFWLHWQEYSLKNRVNQFTTNKSKRMLVDTWFSLYLVSSIFMLTAVKDIILLTVENIVPLITEGSALIIAKDTASITAAFFIGNRRCYCIIISTSTNITTIITNSIQLIIITIERLVENWIPIWWFIWNCLQHEYKLLNCYQQQIFHHC